MFVTGLARPAHREGGAGRFRRRADSVGQERVEVSRVLGTIHGSLVWLALLAAVLGSLVGLPATAAFHRRTRAPRSRAATHDAPTWGFRFGGQR